MIGKMLAKDPDLGYFEKLYVRIFGAPISGLRIRARRILPLIDTCARGNILDAGCGSGIFTFEIAKRYPEVKVTGIDNSTILFEKAAYISAKSGINNCSFKEQDILEMDYNEDFDLALCIDNLEHIENDRKAIRNIYASLKKGGMGIFHVPGYYRRWLFFRKKVNFSVKGHVRPGYTMEEITDKLKKEGFNVLESYYTYGFLETVTNNISYLITGAEKKNKYLYALVFPFLNIIAYFGRRSRPKWGAGVLVKAQK